MSMTRKEFWERHAAIVQRETDGTAVPPSSTHYDHAAHQALHREYYSQWAVRIGPLPADLLRRCKEALDAGDVHMNSPYTSLKEWDDMRNRTRNLREHEGGWSLSFNTCVLKEAARLQIEAVNA